MVLNNIRQHHYQFNSSSSSSKQNKQRFVIDTGAPTHSLIIPPSHTHRGRNTYEIIADNPLCLINHPADTQNDDDAIWLKCIIISRRYWSHWYVLFRLELELFDIINWRRRALAFGAFQFELIKLLLIVN